MMKSSVLHLTPICTMVAAWTPSLPLCASLITLGIWETSIYHYSQITSLIIWAWQLSGHSQTESVIWYVCYTVYIYIWKTNWKWQTNCKLMQCAVFWSMLVSILVLEFMSLRHFGGCLVTQLGYWPTSRPLCCFCVYSVFSVCAFLAAKTKKYVYVGENSHYVWTRIQNEHVAKCE